MGIVDVAALAAIVSRVPTATITSTQPDELPREFRNLLRPAARVSEFDHEVPPLEISQFAESLEEVIRQLPRVSTLVRPFPQETKPPGFSRPAMGQSWPRKTPGYEWSSKEATGQPHEEVTTIHHLLATR